MTRSCTVPSRSASSKPSAIPITRFRAFLLREGILDEAALHELELDVDR